MTYKLSQRADDDIYNIYITGVERFGSTQADEYHWDLQRTFELIALQPSIARIRSEFDPPIRVHVHRAHAIAYQIESDHILIVRVLHGAQDWRRHL